MIIKARVAKNALTKLLVIYGVAALLIMTAVQAQAERFYDETGKYQGRLDDGRIYDETGKYQGRIEGRRLYSDDGKYRGTIHSDSAFEDDGDFSGAIQPEEFYRIHKGYYPEEYEDEGDEF